MFLPEEFIERTRQLMGETECKDLCEALQNESPVSIRINSGKNTPTPQASTPVPWAKEGFYLEERPTFTFDPLFHAGYYYVQEAASMFITRVISGYVHTPALMLDLCAAPGGKSTLARSVLPEGSMLVANEVMRNRSQVLAENLIKWGHPGVIVTNNDPADFTPLGPLFDVILTDVPCSGEGMFRKDENAIKEWSTDGVDLCWKRQRRIVADVWPCLKPGGILIYSTCTFNREENEDNVTWIANELGAEVLPVEVENDWNITGNLTGADFPVYRFLPHRTGGEGLFVAVLRKTGEADEEFNIPRKASKQGNTKKGKNAQTIVFPKDTTNWLCHEKGYTFRIEGTEAKAIPAAYTEIYDYLKSSLRILHAGITLAEQKGKDWQPSHTLAMSIELEKQAFPRTELTYPQALAYLRREAITLDASVPKGYVLVTYQEVALGFVKNLGNRANNLYPQEWRIRSGYTPEEIKMVSF